MEVNYGYDEYYPDMALGMPEDLFRAQQYNISADLRCANSNNEKPDWRHRGVGDPWHKDPKFHDPDLRYREERSLISPPGCRPNPNVINYYAAGQDDATGKESMKSGSGDSKLLGDMDPNFMFVVFMFVMVIYILMSCSATVKDLKKQIKKLQKQIESRG